MIYLDSAATTLIKPPSVAKSVAYAINHYASPGRGGYEASMKAAEAVFRCREKLGKLFHVENTERIVFTSSATHGLNIAVNALVKPGSRVIVSGFEHNSVVRPLRARGADIKIATSDLFEPDVFLNRFSDKLDSGADAVFITHVSNVFGFVLPIYEIAEICKSRGIPLVVDASQSAGHMDVDAERLNARFIAMPGHKGLFGPQGTGVLICGGEAVPFMYGGTGSLSRLEFMPDVLPDMLEAGTHNVSGICGLSAGIDHILRAKTENIANKEHALITRAAQGLASIPGMVIYSKPQCFAQSGVLSFNFYGTAPEAAAEKLAEVGVCTRAGLHCAPLAHKTAGTDSTGTVRMSVSTFTTRCEIDLFLNRAEDTAGKLRRRKI